MVQHRAYKYRIYPTDKQAVKMQHNIDCSRFVYNQILSDRILYHDLYEEGEFTKQERDELQKRLTPGFYKNLTPDEAQEYYGRDFEFLKDTDCYALCNSQLNVESAYRNFYKGITKYPKYKRRDSAKQSYTTNARYTKRKDGTIHASIYVKNSHIRLPKIGMVKINKHRPLYGHIKRVTITKNANGKWFISILCEDKADRTLAKTDHAVGIDCNINEIVLSDGTRYPIPRFTHDNQARLTAKQRRFQASINARRHRMANGEYCDKYQLKNYQARRQAVAQVHEDIAMQRLDFLHKISTDIVKNHDVICVETLRVKQMMRNKKLSKAIANASWGMFIQLLEYKCAMYGKTLIKVDARFASTQRCSSCGNITGQRGYAGLRVRDWTCTHCNTHHDRDENAARNIVYEGVRMCVALHAELTALSQTTKLDAQQTAQLHDVTTQLIAIWPSLSYEILQFLPEGSPVNALGLQPLVT